MAKKTFHLWGVHPVAEALRDGRRKFFKLCLASDKMGGRREEIVSMAAQAGIAIAYRRAQQLTADVGHHRHQGVWAEVSAYPFCRIDQIVDAGGGKPFVLVLDQIVDPHNFGAIVRTAQCAGIHGIVVPKDRSAPPSAAASKASAGALEHARIACVANLSNSIKQLKANGLWVAGADRQGQADLFGADLTGPLALVIGSEEKGLRPLVKKHCDFIVSVPQVGPIGSLNASVAAAVIMYEAFRQRETTDQRS
ncbi:MAG: 23S rRNA (guanosine(2251)-2'-O)-methyltransferase RlmB [Desulfobacteraceae bacterium]|jgi:23S rRNA (guanosine2251-2'-O)-methyltransferase